MNNNRSHDYENYVNSYGMQETQNEARNARLLKGAGPGKRAVEKAKQMMLRLAAIGIFLTFILFLYFG